MSGASGAPQAGGSGGGNGDPAQGGAGGGTGTGEDPNKGGAGTGGGEGGEGTKEKVEDLPEWAQKLIRDTRKEAQTLRGKLTPLEKAAEEARQASLTEAQKLEEARKTAETERDQAKALVAALKAETALAKAGALHPDLLVGKLAPESLNDEAALVAAIENLKQGYPALFGAAGGSGKTASANAGSGGAGGKGAKPDPNSWLRGIAGRS